MYADHPDISTPSDDTVIWRYMNLERLLALLCDKSLFMCRLDEFRDPWEGVWPKPLVGAMSSNLPDRTKKINNFAEALSMSMYVSCWHASEHESAALWDSYAGRAGLVIKSTCGQLKSAIHCESTFYIGEVSYLDHSAYSPTGPWNALMAPFLKRKSFEHEREVRVLVWDVPAFEGNKQKKPDSSKETAGMSVDVNLESMIDAIYLSPSAPNWLLPCVHKLVSKFDVPGCAVIRSQLYDDYEA